ncbi:hypothetical protein GCM10009624_05340 [Gordonia sinesedis]
MRDAGIDTCIPRGEDGDRIVRLVRPGAVATVPVVAIVAAAVLVAQERGTDTESGAPTPVAFSSNRMYLETPIVRGWFDVSPEAPLGGRPVDPAALRIVPGDQVEMRAQVTLRATGSPVRGRLTVNTSGITGDVALRQATKVELTSSLPTNSTVTDADDGRVIDIRVRLAFDGATPGLVAQNERINLDAVRVTVSGDDDDGSGPGPGGSGTPGGSGPGGDGEDARPLGPGGGSGRGGSSGGALPGRDPSTRVPLSSVPSGPTSLTSAPTSAALAQTAVLVDRYAALSTGFAHPMPYAVESSTVRGGLPWATGCGAVW